MSVAMLPAIKAHTLSAFHTFSAFDTVSRRLAWHQVHHMPNTALVIQKTNPSWGTVWRMDMCIYSSMNSTSLQSVHPDRYVIDIPKRSTWCTTYRTRADTFFGIKIFCLIAYAMGWAYGILKLRMVCGINFNGRFLLSALYSGYFVVYS